jgi:hypothetical protein
LTGPAIPEILSHNKFIICANKILLIILALVEKAGLTADRKTLLKGINRIALIQRFNEHGENIMPTKEEIESQIMDLWDEIFDLDDKSKEELEAKYAEWREVEPRLCEGVDELVIHIEAMTGISDESMLIYKEVKEIKIKYKQQKDEVQAKIDALKKEKERM